MVGIEGVALEVKGPGKFSQCGTPIDAWVVHAVIGTQPSDLYFDPKDRSFIASVTEEGMMAKKGLCKPGSGADTSKPAASAIEAGSKWMLAAMIGDEALFAASIHWPSLMEHAVVKEGWKGDLASFRASKLQEFRMSSQNMTRPQASGLLAKIMSLAKQQVVGGVTLVTFDPPMHRSKYTAKSIDGIWYVVDF